MAKKASTKRKGNPLLGCLMVVVIGGAALIGASQNARSPNRTAPTPNAATMDAIIDTAKVIALTPSATITDTPQVAPTRRPTLTNMPQATAQRLTVTNAPSAAAVTPVSSILYYVRSNANARTCPDTACESLGQFQAGEYIGIDGVARGADVSGNRRWYRTQYNGETAFIHDSLVIEGSLVAQPQTQSQPEQVQSVPPVQQPAAPGFTCPSNCAGAVAAGLSAEQAGTCANLDRDDDGVACYGD